MHETADRELDQFSDRHSIRCDWAQQGDLEFLFLTVSEMAHDVEM